MNEFGPSNKRRFEFMCLSRGLIKQGYPCSIDTPEFPALSFTPVHSGCKAPCSSYQYLLVLPNPIHSLEELFSVYSTSRFCCSLLIPCKLALACLVHLTLFSTPVSFAHPEILYLCCEISFTSENFSLCVPVGNSHSPLFLCYSSPDFCYIQYLVLPLNLAPCGVAIMRSDESKFSICACL